ncbi:MAG: hypothetical protein JWP89_654 [Schlesneria sp.]|nr:hypothetical protein [Schlesneria sp.]
MRLEDIQLAIRPRNILECLDIAFLFCGRNWIGLLLTSAAGILPISVANYWILQLPFFNIYLGYLLLMLEIPWATLLLTLYLGQVTFSRKFSLRRAGKDFVRTFGSMIAYQLIVRGLCLAILVLSPVVFLGMYYLNEIILLEQTSLTRTWSRRTAMNARALGRIISFRIMDALVIFLGTLTLASLLRTVSELWGDRFQFDPNVLFDASNAFKVDWQIQAAFWIVIVFLTVFRFVSYLDCRIRREGWDVELKLRALADLHRQREAAE